MSSSEIIPNPNLLSDRTERSITLYFFRQLPFRTHFSDGPIVTHSDDSISFRQIRAPSLVYSVPLLSILYRDHQSPVSDSSSSQVSTTTLSPTQQTTDQPIAPDLIDSFDRLSLSSGSRRGIQLRILELEQELFTLVSILNSQRDQALSIVNLVSNIAIGSAEDRYIPQIEHLRTLLRRSD